MEHSVNSSRTVPHFNQLLHLDQFSSVWTDLSGVGQTLSDSRGFEHSVISKWQKQKHGSEELFWPEMNHCSVFLTRSHGVDGKGLAQVSFMALGSEFIRRRWRGAWKMKKKWNRKKSSGWFEIKTSFIKWFDEQTQSVFESNKLQHKQLFHPGTTFYNKTKKADLC